MEVLDGSIVILLASLLAMIVIVGLCLCWLYGVCAGCRSSHPALGSGIRRSDIYGIAMAVLLCRVLLPMIENLTQPGQA